MRLWRVALLLLLLTACVEPTPELATAEPELIVPAAATMTRTPVAPAATTTRTTTPTVTDIPATLAPSATRTRPPTSTIAPPTNTPLPTRTLAPAWTATAVPPTAAPPTALPVVVVDTQPPPAPVGNCDAAYPDVCIPPPPPDLDCGDIPHRRFRVLAPDPHDFDGNDNDGIGCESG